MKHIADKMLSYIKGIVNDNIDTVSDIGDVPEDFRELAEELKTFGNYVVETRKTHSETLKEMQMHNASVEQFNLLFSELIHYIPQQIIVVEKGTLTILIMN